MRIAVRGRDSVALFRKLCEGPAGQPAVRRLSPRSKPDEADQDFPLRPEGGQIDAFWAGRRVIGEHAVLEDCGEDSGVAALRATGYEPVAGTKPGEPGHLARRIVLGRATLLPEGGRTE